ncbi:MAG: alanine racemase [Planctomycetota bacterium]
MSDPRSASARDAALGALRQGDGPLQIGGCTATDLAAHYGTPLFAYDGGAFARRIDAVRDAFGGRVEVLFALKANPSLALARRARAAGAGAEVASAGEILLAEAAGFRGTQIQMAGPGKSERDLQEALRVGLCVNLESPREHRRLADLARASGRRPRVQIRVNPNVAQGGARLRMADASSRFGTDRDEVVAFARAIVAENACDLIGLHTYGGSQAFDAQSWLTACDDLLHLASEVESTIAQPLRALDFGGGFGWPVYDGDPVFDLDAAGRGLCALLDRHASRRAHAIELGRHLVAGCGVYLTRVVELKTSGGARHAILDGGMHHFGAAAGMGAVMRRAYAIVRADQPRAQGKEAISLGGPLCTPADRFGKDLLLPALTAGDLLAILNAGAYGLSFSPTMFLGHPTPAEVVCEDGTSALARARGAPEDLLRGQN